MNVLYYSITTLQLSNLFEFMGTYKCSFLYLLIMSYTENKRMYCKYDTINCKCLIL